MENHPKYRNKESNPHQLPDHLKESPFRIPEGYFETFNERLQERMDKDNLPKTAPTYRISHKLFKAAAILVILMSIGTALLIKYYNNPLPAELSSFTISLDDLEEAYGMERFDEFTLVSFYLENTDEINFSEEFKLTDKLPSDSTITTEDIEEYLIESNELENLLLNL
jgi:hypothetical protein